MSVEIPLSMLMSKKTVFAQWLETLFHILWSYALANLWWENYEIVTLDKKAKSYCRWYDARVGEGSTPSSKYAALHRLKVEWKISLHPICTNHPLNQTDFLHPPLLINNQTKLFPLPFWFRCLFERRRQERALAERLGKEFVGWVIYCFAPY